MNGLLAVWLPRGEHWRLRVTSGDQVLMDVPTRASRFAARPGDGFITSLGLAVEHGAPWRQRGRDGRWERPVRPVSARRVRELAAAGAGGR